MASKCGEESGATAFYSESNREGTNILVVKGTAHTGMKDIRTKSRCDNFSQFGCRVEVGKGGREPLSFLNQSLLCSLTSLQFTKQQ